MSVLNELVTLERIRNNYKKLLEIFPNDLALKLYYEALSKSIDYLEKEALKKITSDNN